MDLNQQIKLKIKTLMDKKGWKIPTLATQAGVHKQTLYNNLEGENDIKISTLQQVSSALGIAEMTYWFLDYEINGVDVDDTHRNKYETEIRNLRQQIKILTDLVNTKELLIQRLLKDKK